MPTAAPLPASRHAAPAGDESPAKAIVRWCRETALPFWADGGLDRVRGGFHEKLLFDGSPDHGADRRIRVQARQIYVYAHAAHLGWFSDGARLALAAFDALVSRALSPDGAPGFVHLLAPDGSVAHPLRDSYDHAFILLGLAWLTRATGDAQVRSVLEGTLAFMDESMTAGDGTLLEGAPPSLPRRQNPNMHYFEALLALHEALAFPGALDRAARCRHHLSTHFLDRGTGALGEFFDDGWRAVPGPAGQLLEPGHHAEWVWLLRRHERLASLPREPLATRLLDLALRGADHAGFLIDEMDRSHRPVKASRRTWPQTELAKAWIAEAEAGRPGAEAEAQAALARLQAGYLGRPFAAGWIDQFDANGAVASRDVPASTFYHIACAVTEADRVLCRGGTADGASP